MKITEFMKMQASDTTYKIVDANRKGYLANPKVVLEGDINAIRMYCEDQEVIKFEAYKKNGIILYVI